MRKLIVLTGFCLLSGLTTAQDYRNAVRHRPVLWSEVNFVYRTKGPWSFQLDHQYRRQANPDGRDFNVFRNPLQQVFRPWISYQVSKPVRLSLSPAGLWWTWNQASEFQPTTFFQELRVIPQLQLTHPAGAGERVIRFRSELRWPSRADTVRNEYVFLSDGETQLFLANRFNVRLRAMLRYVLPVFRGSAGAQPGTGPGWYVQTSVEPMVVAGPAGTRFDQNRTYLALGRRLTGNLRVEGGYLNQFSIQAVEAARLRTYRFNHALHVYLYLETRRRSRAGSDSGPE